MAKPTIGAPTAPTTSTTTNTITGDPLNDNVNNDDDDDDDDDIVGISDENDDTQHQHHQNQNQNQRNQRKLRARSTKTRTTKTRKTMKKKMIRVLPKEFECIVQLILCVLVLILMSNARLFLSLDEWRQQNEGDDERPQPQQQQQPQPQPQNLHDAFNNNHDTIIHHRKNLHTTRTGTTNPMTMPMTMTMTSNTIVTTTKTTSTTTTISSSIPASTKSQDHASTDTKAKTTTTTTTTTTMSSASSSSSTTKNTTNNTNTNNTNTTINTRSSFHFDRNLAESLLNQYGPDRFRQSITAYLEPPLNDLVEHETGDNTTTTTTTTTTHKSIHQGDIHNESDIGTPPNVKVPLPIRTQTPHDLRKVVYPNFQTCHDMPQKLPVDRGLQLNHHPKHTNDMIIPWNLAAEPDNSTTTTTTTTNTTNIHDCPVDLDPFLPWIHDIVVFPTKISFVAQNKRRCNTGNAFRHVVQYMSPQIALFQSISIQPIPTTTTTSNTKNDTQDEAQDEAQRLAPELYHYSMNNNNNNNKKKNETEQGKHTNTKDKNEEMEYDYYRDYNEPRYRLADYNDGPDVIEETRFRCIFTAINLTTTTTTTTSQEEDEENVPPPIHSYVVEETLSTFPFNYEFIAWRSKLHTMINPRGTDRSTPHFATLLFDCPVPTILQDSIRSGETILSDGTPTLHIDIIPIRTSPRYGLNQAYLNEKMAGPKDTWELSNYTSLTWGINTTTTTTTTTNTMYYNETDENDAWIHDEYGFNATRAWGKRHVLPLAIASGRWTNLPICYTPLHHPQPLDDETKKTTNHQDDDDDDDKTKHDDLPTTENDARLQQQLQQQDQKEKPYELVACVWASASYSVRGPTFKPTNASMDRIVEWIEFALLVGFDHIFVYDNSAANHPVLNLEPYTTQLFPATKVTRIPWDFVVCNNRHPNGANPGERSSQYAAESSCRVRYGPSTTWMASFDLDEYLIPMGNYSNLKQILRNTTDRILDFRSSRTRLRYDVSESIHSNSDGDSDGDGANNKNNNHKNIDPSTPRRKKSTATFLEAYNCDMVYPPKPIWGERAHKEIYRTDQVLHHFVHYSLVTKLMATYYQSQYNNDNDKDENHEPWTRDLLEVNTTEHLTDELNEAVMLHARSAKEDTKERWGKACRNKEKYATPNCVIGFPWPRQYYYNNNNNSNKHQNHTNWTDVQGIAHNPQRFFYNCHENTKVTDYWVPRLNKALSKRFRQKQVYD